MDYTSAQLDLILDAYVEKADVHHVASTCGMDPEEVRDLFQDGTIANQAATRKMTHSAVWFLGIGMDAVQDALVDPDVSMRDRLSAVRLMKDIMAQFAAQPLTRPIVKKGVAQAPIPAVIEAAIVSPSLEDIIANLDEN